MKTITETEAIGDSVLKQAIDVDSKLKRLIVDYVGINSKEYIRDNEITVEMIVAIMADEFPEFLLAVAEENWIRGYRQAINDVDEGRKILEEELGQSDV
tara:strand:+ start:431 stop:727 length:297 start_codon:yes stop_codon:yes gene_type:complete